MMAATTAAMTDQAPTPTPDEDQVDTIPVDTSGLGLIDDGSDNSVLDDGSDDSSYDDSGYYDDSGDDF